MAGISPARRAAWEALTGWRVAGPAKGRLGSRKRPFPPKGLDPAQRTRARRLAEGAVLREGCLLHILKGLGKGRVPHPEGLCAALMIGAWELLFDKQIPTRAAVYEAVALARLAAGEGGARFANALLRRLGDQRSLEAWRPEGFEDRAAELGFDHSLPELLVRRWLAEHGEERTETLCAWSHSEPRLSLRVNRRKRSREELARELLEIGVATEAGPHPTSLLLTAAAKGLFETEAFRKGRFSVQDASQTEVVDVCDPRPGERVLDLCAAPGGKATGLAEASGDEALILAHDRSPDRLDGLPAETERLGLSSIHVVQGLRDPELDAGPIDKVLVDAPCSNTGVLHKRVEARWRFDEARLQELVAEQRGLLEEASARLRPGGMLVYATCSIEPEENEGNANWAAETLGLRLLSSERMLPEAGLRDGCGVSVLLRGER